MNRREFLALTAGGIGLAACPEIALAAPISWIGIELKDTAGNPVPNEPYRIVAPDGRVFEGVLDAQGHARIDGIPSGLCKVSFTRLDGSAWDYAGSK